MEGHRTTCGATAIHSQGIHDTCVCDCSSAESKTQEKDYHSVRKNQQSGDYVHTFDILHNSENPIKYLIFTEDTLLDMGNIVLNTYGGKTLKTIRTEDKENIKVALQAPRPLIK